MNRVWRDTTPTVRSRQKDPYECRRCHRKVYAYPDGRLPIHRHKGKRVKCDDSESPTSLHRKS